MKSHSFFLKELRVILFCVNIYHACGRSSVVEHQLPKLIIRVRFPPAAPLNKYYFDTVKCVGVFLFLLGFKSDHMSEPVNFDTLEF